MTLFNSVSAIAILAVASGAGPNAAVLDEMAITGFNGILDGSFSVSSGTSRVLAVIYVHVGPTTVTSASFGGQVMTQRFAVASTDGFPAKITCFTLGEAGLAAAANANFSQTGNFAGGRMRALAISLENVDQSNPVVDVDTIVDALNAGSMSLASVAGGMAVGAAAVVGASSFTFTGVNEIAGEENEGVLSYRGGRSVTPADVAIVDPDVITAVIDSQQVAGAITFRKASTGGGGGPVLTDRQIALNSGLRKVFVSKSGNDGNSGTAADQAKLTVQAAINILQAGDVLEIDDGIYDETLNVTNIPGTVSNPVLIAAKNAGQVFIDNLIEDARDGTRSWTNEGGGVYSSSGNRPFMGEHNGDYLQYYKSENDLRASSITAFSAIAQADRTIEKPAYGFAFEPDGGSTSPNASGTIFIRLRNNVNPNGQSILLTKNFSQGMIDQNNADNIIWDGLTIRGSGNVAAVNADTACASPTFSNIDFQLCRHGVEVASATLFDNCTYRYVGFDQWCRDIFTNNQGNKDDNGVFVIFKGYFNGEIIGGSSGNALGEGSMDFGKSTAQSNIEIRSCRIGPCFDGLRPGESQNVDVHDNVFFFCRDDAYQAENDRFAVGADDIDVHDNLFFNCFNDSSHQNNNINGTHRHYRNVHLWDDTDFDLPDSNVHKMISTPATCDVFIYHNTYILDYGASVGGDLRLWADFSTATADRIINFFNNAIVIPRDLSDGSGPNPQAITNNAVVGPSSGVASFLTGGGGVFAGTATADMDLNADFSLQGTSPAVGIGRSLPGGLPDSRVGAGVNDDAGAFPLGETPGPDWPRSKNVTFSDGTPPRWTNPGA